MGMAMSTDPTPMSRPRASATKHATSSFEMIAPRGAIRALARALSTPAWSMAATVVETGGCCVGTGIFIQRRNDSNIVSDALRRVGSSDQSPTITMRRGGRKHGSTACAACSD
jgi:hypothetical protein